MNLFREVFGPRFWSKLLFMTFWILVIVGVKVYEHYYMPTTSFGSVGIVPRQMHGLVGIVTAPFIHADFEHLLSNVPPLFVGGMAIMIFYERVADRVFFYIILLGGFLVWLFARPSSHIGASGVVYGMVSFLLFSGLFRRDRRSLAVAFVIMLLNQGFVWGFVPRPGMSWESHLFSAMAGLFLAFIYRKHKASEDDPKFQPRQTADEADARAPDQEEWDYTQHIDTRR